MPKKIDFSKWLVGEMQKMVKIPKSKKERKILADRMHAHLLGTDYSDNYGSIGEMTTAELFVRDISSPFMEIDECISRIKMSALMIKQFPSRPSWKKQKITKIRYMRYHYENYLNEIYLATQRAKAIIDVAKRHCRKLKWDHDTKVLRTIENWYYKQLGNALDVRGFHVHKARFTNEKIDQLESMEFFINIPDPDSTMEQFNELLHYFKEHEYRKLRLQLNKEMLHVVEMLEKINESTLNFLAEKVLIKLHSHYKKSEK